MSRGVAGALVSGTAATKGRAGVLRKGDLRTVETDAVGPQETSRLRVVILDTSSPDEMTGGQSVFIRNLLPRLDADVRVVGASRGREPLGQWQRRTLNGVPYLFMRVARMGSPGHPPRVPLRLTSLLGVARFRRSILAAGDVMYVQSPDMGLPLCLGGRRKPMVLHLHGSANPLTVSRYPWARGRAMRGAYAQLQRRVLNESRAVFSVDEAGLRLCGQSSPAVSATRWVLVPICVDTALFRPGNKTAAREALGLAAAGKMIVFVGRLEEGKGVGPLVDSLPLVVHSNPSVRLLVVGDGSQRQAMEDSARRLGVGDRIVFAGWVEHEELPFWLQAADALILPSAYEGLPTAVIEALACGLPVVATPVGDAPKLVKDGVNGVLLNEPSSAALAQAISRVLAENWSAKELAQSIQRYSAEATAGEVSRLLRWAARGVD